VTGIDLSDKMIAIALQNEATNSKVDFLVADAEELPFANDSFDAVISECSFSVLPDKHRAAREMGRVLKPNGRLVITDIVARTKRNGNPGLSAGPFPLLPCVAGADTLEGYTAIFQNAGFDAPFVEDHSLALKQVGYQIGLKYGGWEEFLRELSSELSAESKPEAEAGTEAYQALLAQAKFGYLLLSMSKK